MFDQIELGGEFFEGLMAIDEAIVGKVAAAGCAHCGGPLHRGDYARKPRGGLRAAGGETFTSRFSLCCGREGCRKRSTPPSVRFLGRRVYVGAAVVIASAMAVMVTAAAEIRRKTGIAPRTVRRWRTWWRGSFVETPVFVAMCARLVPAPRKSELPDSVLVRLRGSPSSRLGRLLALLAPLTTASVPDGSRFVRGGM